MKVIEIGQKIGHLKVLKDNGDKTYLCECDCGNNKCIRSYDYLTKRKPKNKTCGCRFDDITGLVSGHLTAIRYDGKRKGKTYWICKCDCKAGTEKSILYTSIKNGSVISCGCREGRIEHGMRYRSIYRSWCSMKYRCNSENYHNYHRYGGRGITYDPRWEDFKEFYKDMGEEYEEHVSMYGEKDTTLDRIDVDGNYNYENCRWATKLEQANNRSNNHYYRGSSIADWCRMLNLNRDLVDLRLKRGWSEKRALGLEPNGKLIKVVLNVAKSMGDEEKVKILEELLK